MKKHPFQKYFFVLGGCGGLAAACLGMISNVNGIFFAPVSESLGTGLGTVSLNATLTALATAAMAFSRTIFLYHLFGIIRGISSAFFGIPVVTCIMGNWFDKNRNSYMGMVMCCSGIVGCVISPVLSWVIGQFGYSIAYPLCGALIFLFCLPAMRFLTYRPEEQGMLAYGKGGENEDGADADGADEGGAKENGAAKRQREESFLRYRPLSFAFLALALTAFLCQSVCSFAQHLSGYVVSAGQGSAAGSWMISAAMVGNIAAKFLVGVICDKIGEFKGAGILLLAILSGIVCLVCLPGSLPAMFLGSALLGCSYACALMLSILTFSLYGTRQYGKVYSYITVILNTGGALAISVIGYAYDFLGEYLPILLAALIFTVMAFCLLLGLWGSKYRQRDSRQKEAMESA